MYWAGKKIVLAVAGSAYIAVIPQYQKHPGTAGAQIISKNEYLNT
jgi:hypothetical protein